ncbi:hypothetical protein RhiXN_00215 [Rhizoctonia solani]|uniref:Uncharacterized protein n=1 Tax=Rhizoctonia solani TaxID=456999 RepID=A0A8H8SV09_9AGAM|nr:uncharacterized protein RhiXN_00215 [Rhizoctonia solani]QRW18809.1 hypothetical protein RhiXN_00215 [Rhizoctonia solani]
MQCKKNHRDDKPPAQIHDYHAILTVLSNSEPEQLLRIYGIKRPNIPYQRTHETSTVPRPEPPFPYPPPSKHRWNIPAFFEPHIIRCKEGKNSSTRSDATTQYYWSEPFFENRPPHPSFSRPPSLYRSPSRCPARFEAFRVPRSDAMSG